MRRLADITQWQSQVTFLSVDVTAQWAIRSNSQGHRPWKITQHKHEKDPTGRPFEGIENNVERLARWASNVVVAELPGPMALAI